jgi:hypothetical protein
VSCLFLFLEVIRIYARNEHGTGTTLLKYLHLSHPVTCNPITVMLQLPNYLLPTVPPSIDGFLTDMTDILPSSAYSAICAYPLARLGSFAASSLNSFDF